MPARTLVSVSCSGIVKKALAAMYEMFPLRLSWEIEPGAGTTTGFVLPGGRRDLRTSHGR